MTGCACFAAGPISIIAAVVVTSLTGFLGIITLGMATVGDTGRLFSADTATGGQHVAVQVRATCTDVGLAGCSTVLEKQARHNVTVSEPVQAT